ncbi:MAG: ATP-binding protein [Methyloligella sp. ZOD6]
MTLAQVRQARLTSPSVLISTAIGAIGVLLVAILIGRWLTRPLNRLASGARAAFIEGRPTQLPEVGTTEVRTLATALNDMHGRIQRMMTERMQMLAAISHDLRTPLTRMRLRTNGTPDRADLAAVNRDLDEMEAMIEATLDFLREDAGSEQTEPVDLSAILQTIADDAQDEGRPVEIDVPRGLVVEGRHLALKRAFSNLIENAVKYGDIARIHAARIPGGCEVVITDAGPGIAEKDLERVFEPFYRVDQARQRVRGGYGLGLTAARSIIRKHGGEIELSNRENGGLQVRVVLPESR